MDIGFVLFVYLFPSFWRLPQEEMLSPADLFAGKVDATSNETNYDGSF